MMGAQVEMFRSGKTLADARAELLEKLDGGTTCECCGQFAKRYRRNLNSAMARFLIWLVKESGGTGRWVDFKRSPMIQSRRGGGDFAKLEHWDLLEQKPNLDTPSKRCSGLWRPTSLGVAFVHRDAMVPSHVHLYNNRVDGWSAQLIDIVDALGKHFNYQELMSDLVWR